MFSSQFSNSDFQFLFAFSVLFCSVLFAFSVLQCVVFSTFTNAISMWASDWDLTIGASSNVYYLAQLQGDGSNVYGIDSTAFHLLFSNAYSFTNTKQDRQNPQNPNTFAASLYQDGYVLSLDFACIYFACI